MSRCPSSASARGRRSTSRRRDLRWTSARRFSASCSTPAARWSTRPPWRTHLRTLRTWKEERRIRYIGLTHYTVPALDDLAAIIATEPVDFLQFAYSINVRAAETRLLPLAAERGIAVIVNQPFDSGSLFGKVRGRAVPGWTADFDCASWGQFFLKYILSHPAVTCVIPGTARPDHARDNVAAGLGRPPDEQQRKRMAAFWDEL